MLFERLLEPISFSIRHFPFLIRHYTSARSDIQMENEKWKMINGK